jgi:hypothetical protein
MCYLFFLVFFPLVNLDALLVLMFWIMSTMTVLGSRERALSLSLIKLRSLRCWMAKSVIINSYDILSTTVLLILSGILCLTTVPTIPQPRAFFHLLLCSGRFC